MTRALSNTSKNFNLGLFYGLGANILWGVGFLIPKWLSKHSALELTAGRYGVYGAVSLVLLLTIDRPALKLPLFFWRQALLYAVLGNVIYYALLALGVQWAGGSITALIIGGLPITLALYGNYLNREFPFSKLVLPLLLLGVGIVMLHFFGSETQSIQTGNQVAWGLVAAFGGLAIWTWFGVSNANFLKKHPEVRPHWASMVGVGTLLCVVVGMAFYVPLVRVPDLNASYIVGSLIAGVLTSSVAVWMWNKASHLLPVSVAAQLIVAETLTGVFCVLALERKFPNWLEGIGVGIVVFGVLMGLRATRARPENI
jgi:drug/metabolite transporter (DMT)-like permease